MSLINIDDTEPSFLYNVEGKITFQLKHEFSSKSIRQVIHSLPTVIVGQFIYHNEDWINAGTLIAEHLSKRFIPRAEKQFVSMDLDINPEVIGLKWDFETHVSGYSPLPFVDDGRKLCGKAVANWNEFPFDVEYNFKFNISSNALENYKWLVYPNQMGNQLRNKKFKSYIGAIIDSQSEQADDFDNYDVVKAMNALTFLVD